VGVASIPLILRNREGTEVGRVQVPVKPTSAGQAPGGKPPVAQVGKAQGDAGPASYQTPAIAQAGKPVAVKGVFDGNSLTSGVTFGGKAARILAESPRQIVAASPSGVVGSSEIEVTKQGKVVARCAYQSVGVRLSAAKLHLTRGEETTVTATISGLAGMTSPVEFELVNRSPGSVQLKGGDVQRFTVDPKQASNGGYVTTRTLTGLKAGGFSIKATVNGGGLQRCALPELPAETFAGAAARPAGPPTISPSSPPPPDDGRVDPGLPKTDAQGHFRVTLTGFSVHTATIDGALVTDGAGDEVYAVAEVTEIGAARPGQAVVRAIQSHESLIYGDTMRDTAPRTLVPSLTHRTRWTVIQAGNASTTGGLQAGNGYPETGQPPATLPEAPAEIRARLIPMVLWDGVLRRNQVDPNAVVILPTLWEDDNHIGNMRPTWTEQSSAWLTSFGRSLGSVIWGRTRFPLLSRDEVLRMIPRRNDFDRPIGLEGDAYNPFAATPDEATFRPAVMVLTFDSATEAAATNGGVIEIRYLDGPSYGPGDYSLFLHVQLLPM
jgi:hypothetical protein